MNSDSPIDPEECTAAWSGPVAQLTMGLTVAAAIGVLLTCAMVKSGVQSLKNRRGRK